MNHLRDIALTSRDVDKGIRKLKFQMLLQIHCFRIACIRVYSKPRAVFVLINGKHDPTVVVPNRKLVSFMTYLEYIYLCPRTKTKV